MDNQLTKIEQFVKDIYTKAKAKEDADQPNILLEVLEGYLDEGGQFIDEELADLVSIDIDIPEVNIVFSGVLGVPNQSSCPVVDEDKATKKIMNAKNKVTIGLVWHPTENMRDYIISTNYTADILPFYFKVDVFPTYIWYNLISKY